MSATQDDLTPEAFEAACEKARAEGLEVVTAHAGSLLLDLDTAEQLAQFERVLPTVERNFGIVNVERWASKNGNTHVAVGINKALSAAQRVALEAALGSDPVRAVLCVGRIEQGVAEPSRLFKPARSAEGKTNAA